MDGPIYNLEHSNGESLSEFLGIDINTLYDVGFKFYQTGLIQNVFEATGMDNCNGFPTTTKIKVYPGTEKNVHKYKIYWSNSYAYVIGMMLYMASNTRPNIYFTVNQ